ncbi:hypothetical protein SUDANB121_02604 [Nocardiopsis dassonvillei]|uniref:hypothetical protein n=1 Tax=Nocardiopsis dassonvillei TaxID=2014 RepID=UPI003F56DD70
MVKSIKAVILAGAVLAAVGTVAGLLPVETRTASGCGSVFFPSEVYFDALVPGQTCPEAVSARAASAWAPLGGGTALVAGALVARAFSRGARGGPGGR